MKLQVPKGYLRKSPDKAIRPTKAVVRKSIFQRLEPWTDKLVCDFYAGIGTLGIEALSRGSAHVTFVENDPDVLAALERNLAKIGAQDRCTVSRTDVASFLASAPRQFDVVLADPPYYSIGWGELQPRVAEILAPGGVFVMELPRKAPLPENVNVRTFGRTKVGIWRKPT
ncbi:MAG: RsmD family RNA methyltransferase [Candidatus Neomarinimicrobiota bacterium]